MFFNLVSCAAALVVESNDPKVKLSQASELFNNQGRPQGAVTILKQTIPLAQSQNDKVSEATAEFYLGEIHKAPGPRGENLRNPKEALNHYARAISLYNELKFFKNSAFVSWNSSAAHRLLENKKGVCDSLREGEKSHKKIDAAAEDKLPPAYADGRLLEAIQYQLEQNGCKSL